MGYKAVTYLFNKEIKKLSDYDYLNFVNLSSKQEKDAVSTIESTFNIHCTEYGLDILAMRDRDLQDLVSGRKIAGEQSHKLNFIPFVYRFILTNQGIFLFYLKDARPPLKDSRTKFFSLEDVYFIEMDNKGEVIIFYDEDRKPLFSMAAKSMCDDMIYCYNDELKAFLNILNKLVEEIHNPVSESASGPASTSSKFTQDSIGYYSSTSNSASHNQKVNTGSNINNLFSKYKEKVTESNIGKVLGESLLSMKGNLSSFTRYKDTLKELTTLKGEKLKHPKSNAGTSEEIRKMIDELNNEKEKLKKAHQKLVNVQKRYANSAFSLFRKANNANLRIVLGPNGYDMIKPDVKKNPAGLYQGSQTVKGERNTDNLPKEIVTDLEKLADSVYPLWKECLDANSELWDLVSLISHKENSPEDTLDIDGIINRLEEYLRKEQQVALDYESNISNINKLEKEYQRLKKEVEKLKSQICEIDPVLTSFSKNSEGIYDLKWLDNVKKAAENRGTTPYLPLYWNGVGGDSAVFNWLRAVAAGKPNLFIEAATEEGLPNRMKMLDNFISTILLAFPIKTVHFTVLEKYTVDKFVKELSEKICKVYDATRGREMTSDLANQLKEMYREGRDNPGAICRPKEIVIFAGFDRKDRVFIDLINNLSDIIENGKEAGIYFAMVLSKDIKEYDWKAQEDYEFEKYFTPYSTILTYKRDSEGNRIPEYDLLSSKANIPSETGDIVTGTLGDLIQWYCMSEVEIIPNKVYELIENGKLYSSPAIKNLNNQDSKDAGKLVVPVAETEDGEVINLNFDDEDYLSCFILGRSGMGKSYTLHTILTNLMLKYDTTAVEIILMDFKPGGVELNYYKDVPHVSSLLVNGSDRQVASEILNFIINEMNRRGEILLKCNVPDISRYNTYANMNGLEQMKHIILFVDECQDLFKIENPNSDTNIVAEIARKGRSYGIHMVLATQTLKKTDIPSDALAQFSDFLFMGCMEDDVSKCGIDDRTVQKQVSQLVKGEVIYCHRGAQPKSGYVFNYYGKNGEYRERTKENLLSSKFSKPEKSQFYFDTSQIFEFDQKELNLLEEASTSGLTTVPMAALGKNLSVSGDSLYSRLSDVEGANILILGANNQFQSERVLWNATYSLYKINKILGIKSRYYVLPNIPDDVDKDAVKMHKKRLEMLKNFIKLPNVNMVEENERSEIIERIAATVRSRSIFEEKNKDILKSLEEIYLIIPNQQIFYSKMSRPTKGLPSLDEIVELQETKTSGDKKDAMNLKEDNLGFEGLNWPNSDSDSGNSNQGRGFLDISFDFGASLTPKTIKTGRPGKDFDEELRYILEYGPQLKVHVILQSVAPDKIYAGDVMREKEMTSLFNDIIFLRMPQTAGLSIPVDTRQVERLNADPRSLRALTYNSARGIKTIVPFDFPKIEKPTTK